MDATIFASLFHWAQDSVTTGVIGNLAYDALKSLSKSFVDRFKRFFFSEEQTEEYFREICSEQAKNRDKPYCDAKDLYERITNTVMKRHVCDELMDEMKVWMKENHDIIVNIVAHQKDNDFSIRIGSQRAKQIINIQGTATFYEKK